MRRDPSIVRPELCARLFYIWSQGSTARAGDPTCIHMDQGVRFTQSYSLLD